MIPVFVSNGALITRWNGRDFRLLPELVRQLDADGVEFLMYESWNDTVAELRRFLAASGLRFPIAHTDKQIGELLSQSGQAAFEEALKLYDRDLCTADALGAKKLVLHLWNGPCSDSRFDESLPILGELYELAEKRGLLLTIENVTCRENLSLSHLDTIHSRYPEARFTYDTKMALLHDENRLLESERFSYLMRDGLISHLHMNDSRTDAGGNRLPILHIGDGAVDFSAFFTFVKACGFSGTATVESTSVNTDGTVDLEKLNRSLQRVREGLN